MSNTQYYFRPLENKNYTFAVEGIHEIKETDIPISIEDYEMWKNTNGIAKLYRLKETSTGNTLFDYIEEYIPEVVEAVEPGIEEIALDHEYRISKLELGV